jgi:hypothetical protein
VRGHRVEAVEVEGVLRAASAGEVAVIGWPLVSPGVARALVGFVARLVRLDALPVNANGKVDHGALEALCRAREEETR